MKFYSLDSEFLLAPKDGELSTTCVSISDLNKQWLFWDKESLGDWLTKWKPKMMTVWYLRPEFGSLMEWGFTNLDEVKLVEGVPAQRFNLLRPDGKRCLVLDVSPFFRDMAWKGRRLSTLENVADFLREYVGVQVEKLEKPSFLGERKPVGHEKAYFEQYAKNDAYVTACATKWLVDYIGKFLPKFNLKQLYSFATVSKHYFNLPYTYPRLGKKVFVKDLHRLVRDNTYAGRNDAFYTGHLKNIYYLDVKSLYPLCALLVDAFKIVDVRETKEQPSTPLYWIYGIFDVPKGFGLPLKVSDHNVYVYGVVSGLYCNLELEASHAKPLRTYSFLEPVYRESSEQQKFDKMVWERFEGNLPVEDNQFYKSMLNTVIGKLGQYRPEASTSNYVAYSAVMAMSHLVMSNVFSQFNTVFYMDTDSVFVKAKREGKLFDMNFNNKSVPVLLEVKGYGEESYVFRSKLYWLNQDDFAYHGWKCSKTDFHNIIQTFPETNLVTRQVTKGFKTKDKKVSNLTIGRWVKVEEELDEEKLKSLFRADPKRKRKNYDSYTLCKNKQSIASEQWHMRKLKHFQEETFSWQRIEKIVYSRDFLKEIGILEKQRIKTVLDW